MNKYSSRLLKLSFFQELQHCFPEVSKVTDAEVPSSCIVYDFKRTGAVAFFLMLMLSPKRDEFTIELSWSNNGKYPDTPIGLPDYAIQKIQGAIRITRLWTGPAGSEFWWTVPLGRTLAEHRSDSPPGEETLARVNDTVQERVTDAISKIREHVLPFIRRVVDVHSDPTQCIG